MAPVSKWTGNVNTYPLGFHISSRCFKIDLDLLFMIVRKLAKIIVLNKEVLLYKGELNFKGHKITVKAQRTWVMASSGLTQFSSQRHLRNF